MRFGISRAPLRCSLAGIAAVGLSCCGLSGEARAEDAVSAAAGAITVDAARHYVTALADDTFEGRAAGTRGGRAAALFIVQELQSHHLRGAGTKGFYQPFDGGMSNILAVVEGSDPELKNQYVLIGAHYDHVGYGTSRNSFGPTGYIHNGADDNASGVAGLLELAAAFANLPERPKRSVLLAFWDGEEAGLLGSKYWAGHPTVPLSQVVVAVNVDMIGRLRGKRLEVYGTRTSRGLRRLLSEQNAGVDLTLQFDAELKANSDHYSFYAKQLPYLFLHTGLHGDYHRPSDDADKINADGIRQTAQLIFKTACVLANQPQGTSFRQQVRSESAAAVQALEQPLPALPGRLGLTWHERPGEGGLIAISVVPGGPAQRAGLQPGDKILTAAGRDINSGAEFRAVVLAATSPLALQVRRAGSDQPLALSARLTGQPIRIGIAWRDDEAEPDSVIVSRVVPGSPADLAGLRVGDRIYRVAGQDVHGSADFQLRLKEVSGPCELEVENHGRLRTVKVEPLATIPGTPAAE